MRKKHQPGCPCCNDCEVIRSCLGANLAGTAADRQLLIAGLPTALAVNDTLEDCDSDPVNCTECTGPFAANVYVDHYATAQVVNTSTVNPYTAECVFFYRDTALVGGDGCDFANMIELCTWCDPIHGTRTAHLAYEVEIWPLPLQQPAPSTLTGVKVVITMGYFFDPGGGCDILNIGPIAVWEKTITFAGEWADFCAGEEIEIPLLGYASNGTYGITGPCKITSAPGPLTIALQPPA